MVLYRLPQLYDTISRIVVEQRSGVKNIYQSHLFRGTTEGQNISGGV